MTRFITRKPTSTRHLFTIQVTGARDVDGTLTVFGWSLAAFMLFGAGIFITNCRHLIKRGPSPRSKERHRAHSLHRLTRRRRQLSESGNGD